jgi:uncharacterized YigZ family protein
MISIKNNINDTIIVNKSKFISFLYKINNIDDINNYLLELKDKYKDAHHICYAYMIENIEKSDDNGEPKNSAGKPMLDVLKKNKLNYVLAITVRYFGGIKLGKGYLTRTYKNSISNLVKKCELIEMIKCKNINIIVSYEDEKIIKSVLENLKYKKEYKENILYNLNVDEDILKSLNKIKNINIEIVKDIYVEKPITK